MRRDRRPPTNVVACPQSLFDYYNQLLSLHQNGMGSSAWRRTVSAPIILLGGILIGANLGTVLHKSSRVYLFQQALCINYYRIHDPSKIHWPHSVEEKTCKVPEIQATLSMVDGIDSFLQLLPRKSFDPYRRDRGSGEALLFQRSKRPADRFIHDQQPSLYLVYTKTFFSGLAFVAL